ncbi:MAG: phosphatidylglycerol lysyltransferase domain-containing protein [Acidobacteriota bacterium]
MNPPSFPDFKLVEISDQELLTSFLSRFPSEACEMNFANIFLWRRFEHPKFTIIDENLCILCEPPSEPAYFLPLAGKNRIEETIRICLSAAPRISRVPEAFVARYGQAFRSEPDRNNFDYVYVAEDLIGLKGKKYDGKRNRIRKFERHFYHEYRRLSREHVASCSALLERWLEAKTSSDTSLTNVWRDVIQEALKNHEVLGMVGGVFLVDGCVAAFSMGAELMPDTAVIPIEIVDPAYDGLSQLVNREFVMQEWAGCRFINREQDLGIPGLRRAKMSYYPHHLVKKYDILG